jgi:hypothetical protein
MKGAGPTYFISKLLGAQVAEGKPKVNSLARLDVLLEKTGGNKVSCPPPVGRGQRVRVFDYA